MPRAEDKAKHKSWWPSHCFTVGISRGCNCHSRIANNVRLDKIKLIHVLQNTWLILLDQTNTATLIKIQI